MKQTKAAFRNKPFISLKGSILFLILIPMSGLVHAQYSMGTTGQLMIPTAEMQETGTFLWEESISYPSKLLHRFSVFLP